MLTFPEALYRVRTQNNLTQEELGNMIGVSRSTVSLWERDESRPKPREVEQLKDLFGKSFVFVNKFGQAPGSALFKPDLQTEVMVRLRHERKRQQLVADDIASALQMSPATFSRLENGKVTVTYGILKSLCDMYHVPMCWALTGQDCDRDDCHDRTPVQQNGHIPSQAEAILQAINTDDLDGDTASTLLTLVKQLMNGKEA